MNKLITSQKGITLIELLATITISTIVIALIYSIFTAGISLYQKIQTESLIRDDADFIATTIMNELYSNSPRSVKEYSTGTEQGIEMIRAGEKEIIYQGEVIYDSKNDTTIRIYFKKDPLHEEYFNLFIEKNDTPYKVETNSALISKRSTLSLENVSSYVNGEATSGSIQLKLILVSEKGLKRSHLKIEPLELISTFGF